VLRADHRLGVRQAGQRLGALDRQEQPLQLAAEALALAALGEHVIELRGIRFQR